MFFLLRTAFWLTLVLALLPSGKSAPAVEGPQIGATDAVVAASAAVSDVSGFCERQAEACVVGSQAAIAIGQRAQAGAKMVYEFIQERVARSDTAETKPADSKATVASAQPAAHAHHGQSTLKPTDLAPGWRGPAPRKEAQPRRDSKGPA
jgi:hypothetical protein